MCIHIEKLIYGDIIASGIFLISVKVSLKSQSVKNVLIHYFFDPALFCVLLPYDKILCLFKLYRCIAEWIESWDLEEMTSYNQEIGVLTRSAQVGWSFFTRGSHPRFFSTR